MPFDKIAHNFLGKKCVGGYKIQLFFTLSSVSLSYFQNFIIINMEPVKNSSLLPLCIIEAACNNIFISCLFMH